MSLEDSILNFLSRVAQHREHCPFEKLRQEPRLDASAPSFVKNWLLAFCVCLCVGCLPPSGHPVHPAFPSLCLRESNFFQKSVRLAFAWLSCEWPLLLTGVTWVQNQTKTLQGPFRKTPAQYDMRRSGDTANL